jgi:hypothetical protein
MKIKKKFIFYAVLTLVAVISIFLVSYKQNLDSISFELVAEGFNSPVK